MEKTDEVRLASRIKEYGIPEVPFDPKFDRVILFRLGQEKLHGEQTTASGLVIPDKAQKEVDPRAVVVRAGLQAHDYFYDHDIRIGDIVWPSRFSGWEPEVLSRAPGMVAGKQMLFVLAQDIAGSIDSLWRQAHGEVVMERDAVTGLHKFIRVKSNGHTREAQRSDPAFRSA